MHPSISCFANEEFYQDQPRGRRDFGRVSNTSRELVFLEVLKHDFSKVYETFFVKVHIYHYDICGYKPALTSIPELISDKLQRKTTSLESKTIGFWSNILPNLVSHQPTYHMTWV